MLFRSTTVGGTTSVLINFLVGLFVGVASGATVVIAQYFGGRQFEEVRRATHTSMALALAAMTATYLYGCHFHIWQGIAIVI